MEKTKVSYSDLEKENLKLRIELAEIKLKESILIEEREKKLKELSESENKYRLLTESIHDVVMQLSPSGELIYMSPSMSNVVNYETNLDIKKESIFDHFFIEEEKNEAIKIFKDIIENHTSGVIEFMYKPLRNLKEPFPVEVSYKPIVKNGELKMILLVLRDITKRKEAEKARYENEIRFKALSEATFEAIFLSVDGYGIDANEAAIKMFGYSREEISKMFGTDIIAPESKELVKSHMLSGYDKPYDGIALRKDGSKFHAEFQGKLFEYKGKQVRVSSVRDITERKRNEELIRKSERELRISNKTKDKFFSIIAHDLKAPFSSMLGFSELLRENFYEMEVKEQKEIINLIHKGIKNTYELLDNLLFWASSQNGRIAFRPEKLNLFLISNKEVNFLGQQASKKSITVENNIKKSQSIIGDKMMLSIIIRNLINNALKFTPKGGKLIIGCNIINSSENSYIELYFKDNGVGIPKERQAKLFDISENTSTKGTEKEVGTGLGLMLCNEFVKSHKGEITFESEVGKGTTFFVKIPV